MLDLKEVTDWMGEIFQKICKLPELRPGPQLIGSQGEKYPIFGMVQAKGKKAKLIIGQDNPPFTREIPLEKVGLNQDRSALVCL